MTTDFGSLNEAQVARVKVLEAREAETLTSAEKRELEDLKADSKLKAVPNVGYIRLGDPTVWVEEAKPVVKTKLVAFEGTVTNVVELSAADFDKQYETDAVKE